MHMKFGLVALALALGSGSAALAQDAVSGYPERQITMIVPLSPGGAADITGRMIADRLQQRLGQTVIVENRPGAGTTIGVDALAKAGPDGYTIGLINIASHAIGPGLYGERLPYDPIADFAPISLAMTSPNILVVNPDRVAARTVGEFVDHAKAHPDELTYGSSGVGTSLHVGVELFAQTTGISVTHIPYGGSSDMMNDLVGGQIDFALDGAATAWPQVEAGNLAALAVATPERVSFAPDLPTLAETFEGLQILAWHGVAAPAGTPDEIVELLSQEVQAILADPEVRATLEQQKLVPVGNSREEFAEFIVTDLERWTPVVIASGASAN